MLGSAGHRLTGIQVSRWQLQRVVAMVEHRLWSGVDLTQGGGGFSSIIVCWDMMPLLLILRRIQRSNFPRTCHVSVARSDARFEWVEPPEVIKLLNYTVFPPSLLGGIR